MKSLTRIVTLKMKEKKKFDAGAEKNERFLMYAENEKRKEKNYHR